MTYPAPSPEYVGPAYRKSPGENKPIDRIVLHGTVSPTVAGGARSIARYFKSAQARGSAHYVVDPDETLQTAHDSTICWHAPPNQHSIGIEMCDMVGDKAGRPLPLSRWDDKPHRAMLARTARLTAELCLAYDVPVRMVGPRELRNGVKGICDHDDVSDAFGQSSHWDLGNFPRRRFLALVRAEVAEIRGETTTAAVERKAAESRVTRARDLLEQAARAASPRRRRRIRRALEILPHH